jgi:hypothetical protein
MKVVGGIMTAVGASQLLPTVEETQIVIFDLSAHIATAFPADFTATYTAVPVYSADVAGEIVDVGIYLDNTGADGTDPLELEVDVLIGGTTCMTTKPKLTKAASDKANTWAAGTGITVGVVDTTANTLAEGDEITTTLTLTRTTPEDEMAGAKVYIVLNRDVGDN